MVIADFITQVRADFLDDTVTENLWTDVQLTRFIKEAINELCVRASVLNKSSNVYVAAGVASYDIDATIRQIYVAKLDLNDRPLQQTTEPELSISRGSAWRTTTGTPTHYVRRGHVITLYPQPLVSDVLVIASSNITDADDVASDLELIDAVYHRSLMYYVAYKALLLHDADAGLQAKAADYLMLFESNVGIKHSVKHDQFKFDTPTYGSFVPTRMC